MQVFINVLEVNDSVYIEDGFCLFWLNMLLYILMEALAEFRDVISTQSESCSIGVASEIDE